MKSTRDQIVASDFIAPAPAGVAFKGVQTMSVLSNVAYEGSSAYYLAEAKKYRAWAAADAGKFSGVVAGYLYWATTYEARALLPDAPAEPCNLNCQCATCY